MLTFDVTDLSDLPADVKDSIRRLIDLAEKSTDVNQIRSYAAAVFQIVAPNTPVSLLMSSTKDFRDLQCGVKEAEAGIHAFRTYFVERIRNVIRGRLGFRSELSMDFEFSGIAQKQDYYPDAMVRKLREEIERFPLAVSKNEGNIISNLGECALREVVLGKSSSLPTQMKIDVFDCLGRSLTHTEARSCYTNNTFVQKLHNKAGDGDIQKVFHQDTYFSCIKWWYFPDEVTLEHGPFEYAPNSHLLTERRLRYIYEQSIAITKREIDDERTRSHIEGSIRIYPKELKALGWESKPYVVPGNTLVLGNVFGFHRRGEATKEGYRNAIHGSIRLSSPFME